MLSANLLFLKNDSSNNNFLSSKVPDGDNNFKFPWEKNVRLPRTILPLHYDLYLHPDLETGLFSGKVSIEVDNQMPTDHFLVHTKYLDILCWKVRKNGLEQPITEAFEYKPNEFFVIKMAKNVTEGKYVIDLGKFIKLHIMQDKHCPIVLLHYSKDLNNSPWMFSFSKGQSTACMPY